jgi:hypothetical protein
MPLAGKSPLSCAELDAMPREGVRRVAADVVLRAACHPRLTSTRATYHDGVVTLACSVCGVVAHRIRVAREETT